MPSRLHSRDSRSDFIAWRIACNLVVYASNSHVPCYAGARHRAAAEAAQRYHCGVGCKEVGVNLAVSECNTVSKVAYVEAGKQGEALLNWPSSMLQPVLRDEIKAGQLRLLARFKVSLAPC